MRTSIPTCEAKAILGGAGTFTGRYRPAPPWRQEVQMEMWDGEHFIWCRVPKAKMETAEFKSRLMGELKLTNSGWLWPLIAHHRASLVIKARALRCSIGIHRYETVADGYSMRVERCLHCPKLYAYKMRYWSGHDRRAEKCTFHHESAADMRRAVATVLLGCNDKEAFGGDISRPGVATRFWLIDSRRLGEEQVFTL